MEMLASTSSGCDRNQVSPTGVAFSQSEEDSPDSRRDSPVVPSEGPGALATLLDLDDIGERSRGRMKKRSAAATTVTGEDLECYHDVFLSHKQSESQDAVFSLKMLVETQRPGTSFWLDNEQDPTSEGMHAGVRHSRSFLLFCTENVMKSKWVTMELRWAVQYRKNIVLVTETDARRGAVTDFNKLIQDAPEDLHRVFQGHTAIPWYREPEFRAVSINKILAKLKFQDLHQSRRRLALTTERPKSRKNRRCSTTSDGDDEEEEFGSDPGSEYGDLEIMHKNFLYMLLFFGASLNLPAHWTANQRKLYWTLLWTLRIGCLSVCFVRVCYASGPSFSGYFSGIAMVVLHIQLFVAPYLLQRVLYRKDLAMMLESFDARSGAAREVGEWLRARTRQIPYVVAIVFAPMVGLVILGWWPTFLHDYYMGSGAPAGAQLFGWSSAIIWLTALPQVGGFLVALPFIQWFLLAVSTIQLECSVEMLVPHEEKERSLAQQSKDKDKAATGDTGPEDNGDNDIAAADTACLLQVPKRVSVTGQHILRWSELFQLGIRQFKAMQYWMLPAQLIQLCSAVCLLSTPTAMLMMDMTVDLSQDLALGADHEMTKNTLGWMHAARYLMLFGIGVFLLAAMVAPSVFVTLRLRRRVLAALTRVTCEDLGHQGYLRSAVADARKLGDLTVRVCTVVPAGPWCLAALAGVFACSAAPLGWLKTAS